MRLSVSASGDTARGASGETGADDRFDHLRQRAEGELAVHIPDGNLVGKRHQVAEAAGPVLVSGQLEAQCPEVRKNLLRHETLHAAGPFCLPEKHHSPERHRMAVPSQVLFDREMDPLGVFGDRVGAWELYLFMDI